jgi:hypothetical protein
VRLEVPAAAVGLEGRVLNGMAFTLYNGRGTWDLTGKSATPPATFTVSGTVTVSGSPLSGVSFAGATGGSCGLSNAVGQYSCTVPQAFTGTLTPSLSGYTFTPISRSYSNVVANQSAQNYAATAVPVTFTVSGTVTVSGSPLSGVSFSGATGGSCGSSNAAGQYSCTVPQGFTGTLTPALSGDTFTPTSRSYSNVGANQSAQDYAATVSVPVTFTVSGTVTVSGSPLSGVSFSGATGGSCGTSNGAGQYSCTVPQGFTGTLTPALSGDTFTPTSRSYSNVGANQTAQDYTASTSLDIVWFDDAVPAGATSGGYAEGWTWVSSTPVPFSGALAHQSALVSGVHQHYFFGATTTLAVGVGDTLFAYVYLDAATPPSALMLQWNDGSWEHRAYWGPSLIGVGGVDGTVSDHPMGALPPVGQWVRLEVPAAAVGLEGRVLNGMAFTLYNGRGTWDLAGKR